MTRRIARQSSVFIKVKAFKDVDVAWSKAKKDLIDFQRLRVIFVEETVQTRVTRLVGMLKLYRALIFRLYNFYISTNPVTLPRDNGHENLLISLDQFHETTVVDFPCLVEVAQSALRC